MLSPHLALVQAVCGSDCSSFYLSAGYAALAVLLLLWFALHAALLKLLGLQEALRACLLLQHTWLYGLHKLLLHCCLIADDLMHLLQPGLVAQLLLPLHLLLRVCCLWRQHAMPMLVLKQQLWLQKLAWSCPCQKLTLWGVAVMTGSAVMASMHSRCMAGLHADSMTMRIVRGKHAKPIHDRH